MNGFMLPLSGGIDSCSTALIVAFMCRMVVDKVKENGRFGDGSILLHVCRPDDD